jgi:hypothetical protein
MNRSRHVIGGATKLEAKRNGQQLGVSPPLCRRVIEHIKMVVDSLDAAQKPADEKALDELVTATDNLMRALGRVLIEIHRQRSAPTRHWSRRKGPH